MPRASSDPVGNGAEEPLAEPTRKVVGEVDDDADDCERREDVPAARETPRDEKPWRCPVEHASRWRVGFCVRKPVAAGE